MYSVRSLFSYIVELSSIHWLSLIITCNNSFHLLLKSHLTDSTIKLLDVVYYMSSQLIFLSLHCNY
jgi:hypothetical protein